MLGNVMTQKPTENLRRPEHFDRKVVPRPAPDYVWQLKMVCDIIACEQVVQQKSSCYCFRRLQLFKQLQVIVSRRSERTRLIICIKPLTVRFP